MMENINSPSSTNSVMHSQRRYRVGLALGALALTIVIAATAYYLQATSLGNPLFSSIKESDIVVARVFSARRIAYGKEPDEVAVSSGLALEILSALMPNRRDLRPKDWQGLGRLEFKLAFGKKYRVDLFHTDDGEEAAFRMNRVYYRGGSHTKLVKLIREAEKMMEEENKNESGKTLTEIDSPLSNN